MKTLYRLKFPASFLLTFAFGLAVSFAPTIPYRLWPGFDKEEVKTKVGCRVRQIGTSEFRSMKCPADGYCMGVKPGEDGTIIGAEPVSGGYFLIVRWDEPNLTDDYVSYIGRYSSRSIQIISEPYYSTGLICR